MPQHKAPLSASRTPFHLPYVSGRGVVVAGFSLLLAASVVLTGLGITAGAEGVAPSAPAAAPTTYAVPTPEPTPSEPEADLDPPAVLAATDAESPVASGPRAPRRAPQPIAEIPVAARTAYERAAGVLGNAAAGCHLDWTLLAAVGLVGSDHGRVDGGAVDEAGITTPALYGPKLNGRKSRPEVADTDAGRLDAQRRWDRTVGPLRFLPTTWSVVGVDADDDGLRDPQDVDDAALALGVLLCSDERDLARKASLRAALTDVDPARGYVKQVRSAARAYARERDAMTESVSDEPMVVVELPSAEEPSTEEPTKQETPEKEGPEKETPEEETPVETEGLAGGNLDLGARPSRH